MATVATLASCHGSLGSIGATALQLTSTATPLSNGVLVMADPANTAGSLVYVGGAGVTAASAAATDGVPLSPGQAITVEVNNPALIYCIGSTTGLKVFFLGT